MRIPLRYLGRFFPAVSNNFTPQQSALEETFDGNCSDYLSAQEELSGKGERQSNVPATHASLVESLLPTRENSSQLTDEQACEARDGKRECSNESDSFPASEVRPCESCDGDDSDESEDLILSVRKVIFTATPGGTERKRRRKKRRVVLSSSESSSSSCSLCGEARGVDHESPVALAAEDLPATTGNDSFIVNDSFVEFDSDVSAFCTGSLSSSSSSCSCGIDTGQSRRKPLLLVSSSGDSSGSTDAGEEEQDKGVQSNSGGCNLDVVQLSPIAGGKPGNRTPLQNISNSPRVAPSSENLRGTVRKKVRRKVRKKRTKSSRKKRKVRRKKKRTKTKRSQTSQDRMEEEEELTPKILMPRPDGSTIYITPPRTTAQGTLPETPLTSHKTADKSKSFPRVRDKLARVCFACSVS